MARLPVLVCLLATLPAPAEERTFSVSVDGRPGGEMVISYKPRDDGTVAVTVRAEARADRPTAFSFDYRGTQSWKDGRLVRLDGAGTDGGRKGSVAFTSGADGGSLSAGVKLVRVRDDVWPTTGVLAPDPDRKPLAVDVVSGDVLRAKVEQVGPDRVTVGGKGLPATRYRVTAGGSRWDVWYDAAGRLARRVWTRDGREVVAELTAVRRD